MTLTTVLEEEKALAVGKKDEEAETLGGWGYVQGQLEGSGVTAKGISWQLGLGGPRFRVWPP